MKKILITILILILLIGGMFLLFSLKENPDQTPEQTDKQEPQKEQDKITPEKALEIKVIDHLESSVLEPETEAGRIFADYHQFGQEGSKLFLWAYIAEYSQQEEELKLESAFSGPMVITIDENRNIQNHWQPRDGAEYADSIKEKFPQKYQEDALNFQTRHQDILQNLKRSTEKRAEKEMIPEQFDKVLKVGETATITLEANRTTGYKWSYTIDNRDILEVTSDEYQEKEKGKKVVGAGGARVLKIKGVQAGVTDIKFQYARPWKSGETDQPEKVRTFRIKVKGEQAGWEKPELDNKYVSIRDWDVHIIDSAGEEPPRPILLTEEGDIKCTEEYSRKESDDWTYCVKQASEGAAGTVYKDYTYTTIKDHRMITVKFTLIRQQCQNYEEPEREECENTQKEVKPDNIVNEFIRDMDNLDNFK